MELRSERWYLVRTQAPRQSVRLLSDTRASDGRYRRRERLRMVESIVDLVGCIFLSALALLVGSCIVGSIVAALRAVSRGNITVNARKRASHVAETTVSDDRMVETSAMVTTIAGTEVDFGSWNSARLDRSH
jgi:hypothetical protein